MTEQTLIACLQSAGNVTAALAQTSGNVNRSEMAKLAEQKYDKLLEIAIKHAKANQ